MICGLRQHHHHPPPSPLTLPPLSPHSSALQTTLLLLLSLFKPSNPLSCEQSDLVGLCSAIRRQTTVAAPRLLALISAVIETTGILLSIPSAHNASDLGWALQCPHPPVAPPAQRTQPFPPHPPPPYPQQDESAALAAASAIRNQQHRNRAQAKK